MKRVALYVRVSTQEQAEEGYSVGAQLEKARLYCKSKEWIIVDEYVDAGFSGSNLDRPAMQKLIRDTQRHTVDMVLVYKLDRLSRSQKDTLHLIEDVFKPNDVDFTSMQENFDTSTPFGMAIIGILSVFAQLERSQITERMMLGKNARAKEGRYLPHSNDPIGYDYRDDKLVINDYEALQVKEIFHLYVDEGLTTDQIIKKMENYTTKYGSYKWRATIRNILKNPLYVGKFIYGGELYDSTHEAIIDQETFDRAQAITETRRKRAEKQNPNPFRRTTLLSGLLYCGLCGARLSGDAYKTTKNGKKYYKYIYKCYSRKSDKNMRTVDRCDLRYMERDELDAIVWDEILSLNLIIKKDENAIFEKSDRIGDIKIIEKEIKKLDDKIVKLMDLYAIGSMPVDLLTSKVQALNEEKEKLIDNIERIEDEIPELDRDLIVKSIKSASEIKEHGSLDEQRALIFALIDRITVYPDKIHIKYRFD